MKKKLYSAGLASGPAGRRGGGGRRGGAPARGGRSGGAPDPRSRSGPGRGRTLDPSSWRRRPRPRRTARWRTASLCPGGRPDQLRDDERVAGREIARVPEGRGRPGRPGSGIGRRADVGDEQGHRVRVRRVERGEEAVPPSTLPSGRPPRGVGVRGPQRMARSVSTSNVAGGRSGSPASTASRRLGGRRRSGTPSSRRSRRLVLEDDAVGRPAGRPGRHARACPRARRPGRRRSAAGLAPLPVVRARSRLLATGS